MTETGAFDALFVIHRLITPEILARHGHRSGHRHALILSSHQPFAHERTAFVDALRPTSVEFATLADFFDDAELAAIDATASSRLCAEQVPPENFVDAYERTVTEAKNAIVGEKLRPRIAQAQLYVSDRLGIAASAWIDPSAIPLDDPADWPTRLRASASRFVTRLQRAPQPVTEPTATMLSDGTTTYAFWGSLRRLKLKPGLTTRSLPWSEALAVPHAIVAVALHDYTSEVSRLGRPVQVFVDSYLPSNYPRSFLDSYRDASFVCPDPFSARWLRAHGQQVLAPPAFLVTPEYAPALASKDPNTVVLMLNHAGDWAALIHRSDTDRLVAAFHELAVAFPNLQFLVRPHPGMEHARHEGPGAIARLEDFIARCDLANLAISKVPLATDLARGDLFLSEYSATLLDAWQRGKRGLGVNLTGRRSLLQDFTELGFAEVNNPTALSEVVASFVTDPSAFAVRQSAAAAAYNRLLGRHVAGA